MKKDQIEPGMILAARVKTWQTHRYSSPTNLQLSGIEAVPVIVLGVGRYRESRQGLCGKAVELTTYDSPSNVAVLRPDLSDWKNDLNRRMHWTDADCEWKPCVISASTLIPWAEFIRRGEEREMVQMEVNAVQARRQELVNQMTKLIGTRTKQAPMTNVAVVSDGIQLTFSVYESVPLIGNLKTLHDEWVALGKKLECAR